MDKYHNVFEGIEDYAISVLDETGTVLEWNKGAEKLKGYRTEEIVGENFRCFYSNEDQLKNKPEKLLEEAVINGKASDEGWRIRKNGSSFWGNILITPIYDENKKLTGFLKITRDLTERKKFEEKQRKTNDELEQRVIERTEKLTASEKRFHQTLDNMLEGVQMLDFDWKYIYVNDAVVKSSTYSRDELLGYSFLEKYPGVEQSELFKVLERCMTLRESAQFENEFNFPNGTKAFFELSIQAIPEGIFILSIDITDRKEAEEKVEKVSRLYKFNSGINKSIVHINEEQELLDKACKIATEIGLFKIAWIGLLDENSQFNLISVSGDENIAKKILRQRLDYNDPVNKDIPTVKVLKTGRYSFNNDMQNDPNLAHWKQEFLSHGIHSSISLPIVKFGKIVGIFGFFAGKKDFFDDEEIDLLEEAAIDISFALENFEKAKKHAETEELVEKNEKRFRALIENSTDIKILASASGKIIYASPAVTRILGYSNKEFLGKSAASLIHHDDLPELIKNRTALVETPGKSFTFQYRFLHKTGNWLWCEGSLTNMLHEPAVNAMVSNFRDISENKQLEEQLYFDRSNLNALINNTKDLLWSVNSDLKLITFNQPFYKIIKLASGKEVAKGDHIFSLAFYPEQSERFKALYARAFRGEAFTEIEYIETPVEYWSEISFCPIRNGNQVVGTACQSHNITERKKAEYEREKMIEDILQRNKNFEQFAYIVSHNLRGPVANILGIAQVLESEISVEDQQKTREFLFKATENLDEIVRDLNKILEVRNEITESKIPVHFSELVSNIKSSIQNLIQKQNATIITDFSKIEFATTLNSYLHSIFYNLILNSIKYRRTDTDLEIVIRSELKNGKILLSFKDNGLGIDLKVHGENIFRLYKRFHLNIEGKGIGLFMVKTQIEVLGGSISVNSEPNLGTEFIIELPM